MCNFSYLWREAENEVFGEQKILVSWMLREKAQVAISETQVSCKDVSRDVAAPASHKVDADYCESFNQHSC